jgi:hypothetical protein
MVTNVSGELDTSVFRVYEVFISKELSLDQRRWEKLKSRPLG